ncbi:MAG: hypothetical protein AB8F74_09235, partial [Saprospiraceae bacterium]
MKKELKLIIACLMMFLNGTSQDTFKEPNHKMGLSFSSGVSNNEYMIVDRKRSDLRDYLGFDLQLGAFYEKRLSRRFVLSTELGLRYSDFYTTYGTCDNDPLDPTHNANCHQYQSDWNMFSIPATLNLKFYYFKRKQLYIESGFGLDFRLNKAPELEYQKSSIIYRNGERGEGFIQSGKDREDGINLSA